MIWKAHTKKSRAALPPAILPLDSALPQPAAEGWARQALLDQDQRTVAWTMGLNSPDSRYPAAPLTANQSAGLISDAFSQIDFASPDGSAPLLLPLSEDTLHMDFVDLLPRQKIVIELAVPDQPGQQFAGQLENLQARGFRIALRCSAPDSALDCYQHASYAIIELGTQRAAKIDAQLALLSELPLKTVARGIVSSWQYQAALMRGFDWFQGDFVGALEQVPTRLMEPDATTVMRTFNMVAAHDEVGKIEDLLKRDTALCYRLLCYVNSAGFGLHYRVESIRHAISVIGYEDMLRWLGLLSFAGVREQANQRALLNSAALRGRLVELLGQHSFSTRERGHAYLVGMFSMLDRILGIPLLEAVRNLNLASPISEALLSNGGKYMPYLRLALALERQHLKEAELYAKELGFDLEYVCRMQVAANTWARAHA